MNEGVISVIVWLIGSVICYFPFKAYWKLVFESWTVGDRNFAFFVCIISSGIGAILFVILYNITNNNKNANW